MGHLPTNNETLSKLKAFLKDVPLFAELSEENVSNLSRDFRLRKYKKREIIFHQGDESHVLYILMKGNVRIFRISPDGNETTIRIIPEYDIIGEFAAIDQKTRSASAQALGNCILLEMGQAKFLQSVRTMPNLAMGLIRILVDKLRWATTFAETIAQYDTVGRLLHIILYYNKIAGKEIAHGKSYSLDLSMNQADLASLVGARREWVNRILKDLSEQNLLEYKRGRFIIYDLPAIEAERDRRMELYVD